MRVADGSEDNAVAAVIFSDPPLAFSRRVVLLESVTVTGDDLPFGSTRVIDRMTLLPAILALTFTRQPFGAVAAQVSVNFMLLRFLLSLSGPIAAR